MRYQKKNMPGAKVFLCPCYKDTETCLDTLYRDCFLKQAKKSHFAEFWGSDIEILCVSKLPPKHECIAMTPLFDNQIVTMIRECLFNMDQLGVKADCNYEAAKV